jgi:GH43 family beta-xylosidase
MEIANKKYTVGKAQEAFVRYCNDLADGSMKDFDVVFGKMEVRDGALRVSNDAKTAHSTALLRVDNPADYVFEADFVQQMGGGIFVCGIGARAKASTETEDLTNGYYAYIGAEGDRGALGVTNSRAAWMGDMTTSDEGRFVPGSDLHLYVKVSGDFLIYIVSDAKTGEELYRCQHKKGETRYDCYPVENGSGLIAFRVNKAEQDGGFTNIKLTDVKTPVFEGGAVLGKNEKLTATLTATPNEELIVFTDERGWGYAFSYDAASEKALAYRYIHGKRFMIGQHAQKITAGKQYSFTAVNHDSLLSFYFGDQTYPILECKAEEFVDYRVGATDAIDVEISPYVNTYTGRTFTNPIFHGADPEILLYDGTYYSYVLDNTVNKVCRVRIRTSKDLIQWEEAGFGFELDENSPINFFMSPNVFYKDGWFYLLIASRHGEANSSDYRVYYASARSPLGPFVMNEEHPYVNDELGIGGAPFVDDDGRVYLTYVYFERGNNISIQEILPKDGVITVASEVKRVITPSEWYEIDDYGRISEGGVLIKHNGYYYMMYATGHFRGHYGEAYAVSKDILGPYTKYKYNTALTHNAYADGAGDCVFVKSPDGKENFVAYHCHSEKGNKGLDRWTCIDRIYFVPAEDGGPDVLRVYGPTTTPQPVPSGVK